MKVVECPYCQGPQEPSPFVGVATVQCAWCQWWMVLRTDGVSFESSRITVSALLNGARLHGLAPRAGPSLPSEG